MTGDELFNTIEILKKYNWFHIIDIENKNNDEIVHEILRIMKPELYALVPGSNKMLHH
jgi:hypothetical protein